MKIDGSVRLISHHALNAGLELADKSPRPTTLLSFRGKARDDEMPRPRALLVELSTGVVLWAVCA